MTTDTLISLLEKQQGVLFLQELYIGMVFPKSWRHETNAKSTEEVFDYI